MPKTKKLLDWEVYDKNGNFLDILTMSRHDANEYVRSTPGIKLQEIDYTE